MAFVFPLAPSSLTTLLVMQPPHYLEITGLLFFAPHFSLSSNFLIINLEDQARFAADCIQIPVGEVLFKVMVLLICT